MTSCTALLPGAWRESFPENRSRAREARGRSAAEVSTGYRRAARRHRSSTGEGEVRMSPQAGAGRGRSPRAMMTMYVCVYSLLGRETVARRSGLAVPRLLGKWRAVRARVARCQAHYACGSAPSMRSQGRTLCCLPALEWRRREYARTDAAGRGAGGRYGRKNYRTRARTTRPRNSTPRGRTSRTQRTAEQTTRHRQRGRAPTQPDNGHGALGLQYLPPWKDTTSPATR